MRGQTNHLFSDRSWFDVERQLEGNLTGEIQGFDADRLLNSAPDALTAYFVEKFTLNLPTLRNDDISVEQRETEIDVSHRFDYGFRGYGSGTVRGMEYEVHVPFDGDSSLLSIQPTTFSSLRPQAIVRGQLLVMFVRDVQLTGQAVEAAVDEFVASVRQYLGWLGGATSGWNSTLGAKISKQVDERRRKLIADRTTASSLKFKIRERPGTSKTYAAPEVRRKVTPSLPPVTSTPWKPEPVLEMAQYEHILRAITDASRTWEHSPAAFAGMGEEDLRTQFLFFLNGHYQGDATAETFNKQGKTDILIRSQGRNIFIAECKFWGGPKVLTETLDQILGYVSWRDTKVAVILFNRNKDFSGVLEKIVPTATEHPNCKKFVSRTEDTQYRFIFCNKDDAQRELVLTIMAFNVPQPDDKE